jgi:hypothetical protein
VKADLKVGGWEKNAITELHMTKTNKLHQFREEMIPTTRSHDTDICCTCWRGKKKINYSFEFGI